MAACGVEEEVLREEWAAQVREQTKPLPRQLACYPITIILTKWILGQSRNQALHTINIILVLEKSLTLVNENIRSLEIRLMGNAVLDSTDGTDIPEQLDDSHAQQAQIATSLHHKRAALGVSECAHLASLHRNNFLRIRMNARSLKHRICNRLCQCKFELEKLERAYRQIVNGK